MTAVRHLGFWTVRRTFRIIVPNFAKIGYSVAVIYRFSDFQDGGRRHLGFLKIRNFDGMSM